MGLYVEPEDLVYYEDGSTVFVDGRPQKVRALRRGKKGHEVAFDEVLDRTAAETLRGLDVHALERREIADHEFWPDQLIGLEVQPGGGWVVDVVHGPAQDRLVVHRDGRRFEVPFVEELVPVVSLDAGYVEIVEIPGLIEPTD